MQPKCRILLVEDHEDTIDLMVLVLAQSNYDVLSVKTVAAAYESAQKEQFDLFVLDSWLPDGSGIDLCRRIRELDGSTPIVFCSGVAFEKDRNEALASGAQKYLVKPLDMRLLCETVDELVAVAEKPCNTERSSAPQPKRGLIGRHTALGSYSNLS